MPSLLPGFEYDIFISYRHKDNKGGHWVTEFVDALKTELEATFKEDISIYFDENPHDGLLETHNVDKSLEGKLKSLIFIPIISQTYCDPKSFAWQHEYCVFNKLAKADPFGRDIKLSNGNVASRILPIKIHDIDAEDKSIIENEIGGVLRAIEFIYREPGVNRPLKSSDSKNDNLNKTEYRNQVNKVANAIKEIIECLIHQQQGPLSKASETPTKISSPASVYSPKPTTKKRLSLIATGVIVVALISYFIFQSNFQSVDSPMEAPGKSIAVLPFENLSGDKEQEYFSDGVAEEILIALAQIKDLKVAGRTSSFRFKGKEVDIREVGEVLKVSTVLEGSVRRQGNRVKISARLLNVEDGYQLWSEQFESTLNDIFKIQEEIALAISQRLRVTLLQNESLKLGKGLTQNSEAYDAVLKGRFFWDKRILNESEKYFKQAIELDPTFAEAYVGLAETYVISPFFKNGSPEETMPKAQAAAEKAIQLDSSLTIPYFVIAFKKTVFDWNRDEARTYFKKAFSENSKYAPGIYWHAQFLYCFESDFDGSVVEMRKAVEIEPLGTYANMNLGFGLFYARKFKEALEAYKFSIQLDNLNPLSYLASGWCNIGLEKWDEAQKSLEISASQNNDLAKSLLVHFYVKNGNTLQAQKLYGELSSLTSTGYSSQFAMSDAASFLGKKDLAHEHFKKAIQQHETWLPYMLNHPARLPNDALSDPKNMALMKKYFPFMGEQR
jgi:adenylate cyclase